MSRTDLQTNNLDLVRFALASTVFLVHGHALSGESSLAPLSAHLSSDLAVKAFFVVSGLLVTMSYERSNGLREYAEKRLRRIYPAYATVVLLSAIGLVLVSTADVSTYFSSSWWRYVAANLAFANFLQPTLPGVFDRHLVTDVNGALWTLKVEVMFYATVPLMVTAVRRWGAMAVLAGLYVTSMIYAMALDAAAARTGVALYAVLARQLPGQLAYFVAGAAIYYGFNWLRPRWALVAGAGAVAWAAQHGLGFGWLEPVWIAALVAVAGFSVYLGHFGRRGDLSYGIYILHFPLVQLLVGAGLFRWSPWGGLGLAAAMLLALAFALWHLIERPWLGRSSHYVVAQKRRVPTI